MNKWYYIMSIVLLLGVCGCEKFLEESSQNEVRPGSVIDLEELLMGEVYPVGTTFHNFLDLLTDDVDSRFSNPSESMSPFFVKRWGPVFTFQKDMYELLQYTGVMGTTGTRLDCYEHYFKRIKGCNVVLEMLDKVKGDDDAKANVRGQALAMRAWLYFMVVNLYGQPYNANPNAPGVPLLTSSMVKDLWPPRASVAAIYAQVEADLLEALPLIERYGQANNKYKVTDMFVYTFLSRMYLYMENWEEAEKYATKGIQKNPNLLNLANFVQASAPGSLTEHLYSLNSPEAIWWGYGTDDEFWAFDWPIALTMLNKTGAYKVSSSLQGLYEYQNVVDDRKDMRYIYYYSTWNLWIDSNTGAVERPGHVSGNKKSTGTASTSAVKGMRVAELYLNRAEARIHLGKEAEARDDLNFLRRHRYDTRYVAYQHITHSGEALVQFCKDERRRELSYEDHRWFDLRRYGMPEIRHTYQEEAGQSPQVYTLTQGDPRYVFAFPEYVLKRNPSLTQNP